MDYVIGATRAQDIKRYRVGVDVDSYCKRFAVILAICFITAMTLGVSIAYMVVSNQAAAELSASKAISAAQIRGLRTQLDETVAKAEIEKSRAVQEAVDPLNEQIEQLTATVETIQAELDTQLETDMANFDWYRRFWFVLKDAPSNSGITMEAIKYSNEKCKEWDINPLWLWHIYQTETGMNAHLDNGQGSGARGLGQVMPATGRAFWEDILGHGKGSFRTEMLYDPMVNIEITVAHLGRDLKNGSSWFEAVNHYSGGGGQAYYNKVVRFGASHGIELNGSNYRYPW